MVNVPTVTAYTLATALGTGRECAREALWAGRSGLAPLASGEAGFEAWYGHVPGLADVALPAAYADFECRNNRLALQVLETDGFAGRARAALGRYGAHRVGVFLGTSTSGIAQTEAAYARRDGSGLPGDYRFHETHELGALSRFVAAYLGVTGPVHTISTACSSSAKVFGAAQRYMAAGLCDAAIVGGVDSFCLTTLYGFNSLELISRQPCRPWGANRDGISIGEAGGFALLEPHGTGPELLACAESSDAYHISAPHPDGAGARVAMEQALERASLPAREVDYINLHGTGTPANDAAEDRAVTAVFGDAVGCSSTKGLTGHTLGAAGIVEALFCCLALDDGFIPGGVTEAERDPALRAHFVTRSRSADVRRAVSLSLGFGGSNCCLVLGRPA
ncbi:beta-ketoacyl-[acyl-carrier-protein] synthase family protein [Aquisalimonas lutea]|uniref:beta-ketoacyl-[acyl-carrier-protein] synthase family protein n=1 Tax=Aquisalimonas lutea TaxID=1327750 RepID=UPI0025B2B9C3|nr:beta-ketoacyl-[acyl-carrier-protein] synthase family protein [Aquisalimonas lutea]MDN3517118.1 beta-ketoacyl-[acyl-carrier-protein] synthase family protein [Aquisalimonas lutea]